MGGTKALMGLTVTVSCLVGIPPLLLSDTIFRKIGHPNVQVIGFAVYVIRLVGTVQLRSVEAMQKKLIINSNLNDRLFLHPTSLHVFDL